MDSKRDFPATPDSNSACVNAADNKQPRTARGQRTRKALIDAAAIEFGEKGFHEGSISGITSRAGVALGSFYTYYDSKDAIFRALVKAMSEQVRDHVAPALVNAGGTVNAERHALKAFLDFASEHRELYRIIDEAEFVDPDSFRRHYETTAQRIAERLQEGAERGEVISGVGEVEAWAIMGMNVFLGLRFGVWGTEADHDAIAERANRLIAKGISGSSNA